MPRVKFLKPKSALVMPCLNPSAVSHHTKEPIWSDLWLHIQTLSPHALSHPFQPHQAPCSFSHLRPSALDVPFILNTLPLTLHVARFLDFPQVYSNLTSSVRPCLTSPISASTLHILPRIITTRHDCNCLFTGFLLPSIGYRLTAATTDVTEFPLPRTVPDKRYLKKFTNIPTRYVI